jgi:peptidyl-prolyl cis-trans isomerase B (cyclophilin B)
MQRFLLLIISFYISLQISAQTQYPIVVIETTMGDIELILYDNTFRHSENFVKLIKEGYYNGQLFHRTINNFMIQAGDDQSIDAKPGVTLGHGGKDYTLEAEFFPEYYHKKGALAAARQGDQTNPEKRSSGSQFYIVQGKTLDIQTQELFVQKGMHPPFTDEQKEVYSTIGGTPHLDYSYTVFGEVIKGLDIVDKIAAVEVDKYNRPLNDIRIIKMYTLKN